MYLASGLKGMKKKKNCLANGIVELKKKLPKKIVGLLHHHENPSFTRRYCFTHGYILLYVVLRNRLWWNGI